MGIVVDLIIVGILVLSIFLGYRKGLIKLAISLCATVIAIVATSILYTPISNLIINTTSIDETVENCIYEHISGAIKNENKEKEGYIKETENKMIEDAKNNILPETARKLAINIVNIGVMIVLFLAVRIGIRFITALADMLAKLPIIKQFNKAGGIIYGVIRGLLIIYIVLEIISIFGKINPENNLNKDINESNIGKIMYNNNVINVFLK